MTYDEPFTPDVLERLQGLQQQLLLAQHQLTETTVSGSAGGGMVTITMLCSGEVTGVKFEQAVIDEGDAAQLAALTMSAHQHALDSAKSVVEEQFGAVMGPVEGLWH